MKNKIGIKAFGKFYGLWTGRIYRMVLNSGKVYYHLFIRRM